MCTFGDLKFYSSRAFLDGDEEDEDCDVPHVLLELKEDEQLPSNIETVVVSFGALSNNYCKSELLSSRYRHIGSVSATFSRLVTANTAPADATNVDSEDVLEDEPQADTTAPVSLADLYTSESVMIALCYDKRNSDVANMLAQKIMSVASPDVEVVVLTTQHLSKLRAANGSYNDSLDAPLQLHCVRSLRNLKDDCQSRVDGVRALPQPAIIDSVPAAVLIYCTMKQLPCVVYVAYTETISSSDVETVRDDFNKTLQRLGKFAPMLSKGTSEKMKHKQQGSVVLNVPHNYL